MSKKYFQFLFFSLTIISFRGVAQDVHSSVTYMNPVKMNPAFTGLFEGKIRAWTDGRLQFSPNNPTDPQLHYRNENKLFVYRNFELGADFSFVPKNGKALFGAGLNFLKDESGTLHLTRYRFSFPLSCSFHPAGRRSDWFLSAGIQPNIYTSTIDVERMSTASQYINDYFYPDAPTNEENLVLDKPPTDLDLNAGVGFVFIDNTKGKILKPYNIIGLSINHIHPFNLSYYSDVNDQSPRYVSISYSGMFNLRSDDKFIQFQTTLNYYSSSFRATPGVSLYVLKATGEKIYFPFGLQFDFVKKYDQRFDFDALTFVFKFLMDKSLDAAISYDLHFSELKKTNQSPELIVVYRFLTKQNKGWKGDCPRF